MAIVYLDSDSSDTSGDDITQNKYHFVISGSDSITVSEDPDNPSYFSGAALTTSSNGFELFDATTGAVKNISGETIEGLTGNLAFQPNNSSSSTIELFLWSEESNDDGATWTVNADSLRTVEISGSGESFKSIVSLSEGWIPDRIVRFAFYVDTSGLSSLTFDSPTTTVNTNQTVSGRSFIWNLQGV